MDRKLWKIAGAAVLASSVMTIGPARAQSSNSGESPSAQSSGSTSESPSGNASGGQSTPSQFEQQRTNGGDKDWGWLGLFGLLGLAGLRRRRDRDLHRDTTSAKRGSGAYNSTP
jgi:MYXO-CTERM domain-containing protein